MIFNLFPKFQVRHDGFLFYGLRLSDEGADTESEQHLGKCTLEIFDPYAFYAPRWEFTQ